MRRLLAFLRRDFRIAASYRTPFIFMAVGGLITLTTFHFLGVAFDRVGTPRALFGTDYFSFALLGVAVAAALRSMQTSFARRLREAQTDGSLEVLLSAPLSTFHVIALMAAYPVVNALVRAIALLVVGRFVFGADLHVNLFGFAAVLTLGLLAFGAVGLLSAAFVLSFKRGDPFGYALDVATYLLAGVVFPVTVLPPFLQSLSLLLPATWALSGLRAAALRGASVTELWPQLLALAGFCAVLWPMAAVALALSRRHAERAGTLAHF